MGSLCSGPTYQKHIHLAVQQKWIIAHWQQRKLAYDLARKEIIAARGHTASYVKEIDYAEHKEREEEARKARQEAQALLERRFHKFKKILSVELWKRQYLPRSQGGIAYVEPRFKISGLEWAFLFREDAVR